MAAPPRACAACVTDGGTLAPAPHYLSVHHQSLTNMIFTFVTCNFSPPVRVIILTFAIIPPEPPHSVLVSRARVRLSHTYRVLQLSYEAVGSIFIHSALPYVSCLASPPPLSFVLKTSSPHALALPSRDMYAVTGDICESITSLSNALVVCGRFAPVSHRRSLPDCATTWEMLAGGTGFLGQHLVQRITDKGARAKVAARSPPKVSRVGALCKGPSACLLISLTIRANRKPLGTPPRSRSRMYRF